MINQSINMAVLSVLNIALSGVPVCPTDHVLPW